LGCCLVQLVVLRYLADRWPLGYQIGIAAGFIDADITRAGGLVQVPMPTDVVVWSAFEQFFADPKAALRGHFSAQPLATVADANTTMDTAVERFGGLATALGIPWRYGYAPQDAAALGVFAPRLDHAVLLLALPSWVGDGDDPLGVVVTLSSADQDDLGVVLAPLGSLTIERDLTAWHLSLSGSADIQAIALGGGTGFQVLATSGAVDASLASLSRSFVLAALRALQVDSSCVCGAEGPDRGSPELVFVQSPSETGRSRRGRAPMQKRCGQRGVPARRR
jgi:hypothetical protein